MAQEVTQYAVLYGEQVEHIWKRKIAMGMWRSLCGNLSDGPRLRRTYDGIPCHLCERIQQVKYQAAREKARHEQHKFV